MKDLAMTLPPDWRALNQANWDERVAIHLNAPDAYDLAALRAGTDRMDPIAADILGPVDGLRILHLQCHFGMGTLLLARMGATVTGLDFSPAAIKTARGLADELGLAGRARFVEANVYDAMQAIPEPAAFDRVFVSWAAGISRWPRDTRSPTCSTTPLLPRAPCRDGINPISLANRWWKTAATITRIPPPAFATHALWSSSIHSATPSRR
jgi:hypothetical protein